MTDRPEQPRAEDGGPLDSRVPSASSSPVGPEPSPGARDPIAPWAGAFGGLLLAGGALSFLGYLVALTGALVGGSPAELVAVPGSLAILLGLLGSGLLLGALGLRRGQASQRFAPTGAAPWLTMTLLALALGTALLMLGLSPLTAIFLPFLHAAATILPTLALVGFVIGAAGGPSWASWRGVLARLSWGACVATFLGLIGEAIAMVLVALLAYLFLTSSAGGQAALDALLRLATSAEASEFDLASLEPILHPVVIVAAFSILAVIAPLVEELAKLAGVAARPPATRAQAWIWGCTVGAGFGLLEGVFYAALQVTPLAWPLGTAARGLTMLMHASMTGVAALGYLALRRGRRRGLLYILASIIGHGLWNGLALATVLFSLLAGAGRDAPASAGGAPAIATVLLLIALFYLIFFGFLALSRRMGRLERARAGEGPPALPVEGEAAHRV